MASEIRPHAATEPKGDLHSEHQILNMGPSHPATHGTVKFLIELDGETIVDLDVQVGYLHRGFEKECEGGAWYQAIPYTDRLNYNSAILCNIGYCMAVEKLLGIETPERCQWLRVLSGELSRIGDHLTRCGAACLELQAMTPFLYGIEARELNWDLQEALCGARVTSNYIRIGGVKHDMPPGFPD
ncbi:MAG TPA: NADH-quinone oxidoreductase subunit D, partial [Candidatus Limnocylindrales bacterium]|nr:NADH-quinone oxidoreductase subunit D [Candidatus Limnocylindrales bacterium]